MNNPELRLHEVIYVIGLISHKKLSQDYEGTIFFEKAEKWLKI